MMDTTVALGLGLLLGALGLMVGHAIGYAKGLLRGAAWIARNPEVPNDHRPPLE